MRHLTLHPSHVNAPKWYPAAGSPHTLHNGFMPVSVVVAFVVVGVVGVSFCNNKEVYGYYCQCVFE